MSARKLRDCMSASSFVAPDFASADSRRTLTPFLERLRGAGAAGSRAGGQAEKHVIAKAATASHTLLKKWDVSRTRNGRIWKKLARSDCGETAAAAFDTMLGLGDAARSPLSRPEAPGAGFIRPRMQTMFSAMQAVSIEGQFGLDHLQLVQRPTASPALGQVRLRMRAASLNYRDLLMAQGKYNPRQPLPLVLGSDGVGEVVEVGPGVSRIQVGERACPIFAQEWIAGAPTKSILRSTLGGPRDGTLTQEMVLSEQALVRVPDALSDDAAATLPCAAVTAWSALVTQGRVCAGQTVLTQGTGGVSIFALQIAKMLGARVIVTSKSDEKLERARALGADETINYETTQDWGRRAKEIAGGDGVDHVIEVGGGGTLGQSLRAVRPGGTISVIGVLSGNTSDVSLLPLLMQNVRMQGVMVGHRDSFEALLAAAVQCKLSPVIDRRFALAETKQALTYLKTANHLGKIVVRIAD